MTSNKSGEANYDKSKDEYKVHFRKLMELMWNKIYERFPTINAAFRFFDSDYVLDIFS